MASTASRIMRAFRSMFGRVNPATSQNPLASTSKIPVTSSIPKSEALETSQKSAPESSDASLRDKTLLSQSNSSSQAPAATATATTAATATKSSSVETKEQPVTSSSSEASKPVDVVSQNNDSAERVAPVQIKAEAVPNNPPNVITQTLSNPEKPPKPAHTATKQPLSENVAKVAPLKSVKAHVPLIKFRKGQLPARVVTDSFGETYQEIKSLKEPVKIPLVGLAAIDEMGSSTYPAAVNMASQQAGVESLEWWQTPDKFKRRFIDEKECDIINSGGSDQIFN